MAKIQFNKIKNTFLLLLITAVACGKAIPPNKTTTTVVQKPKTNEVITGASQLSAYLPLLQHKKIALVSNPTSIVFSSHKKAIHLVDTLLSRNVTITKVFAPEHGFRGKADAGEVIKDGIDLKTKLPIISLYGKQKKPSPEMLKDIDILIFDIQDVGARFYTYISTLHYVMEACAENNIPVLILDRPNPNGHYVDGPILETEYKSFVGMHPIPIVHGMTIGEYATMINGEYWLKDKVQCKLSIIQLKNYTHTTSYSLPVKPSPNLPNPVSINLYPSLCLFEGTNISVGRGTDKQFQIYGAPQLPKTEFNFIPKPNEGSTYPKHKNKVCYGEDLSTEKKLAQLNLKWLITAYKNYPEKKTFFNSFFKKLAGSETLQQQIEKKVTEQEIRASWEKGLINFKQTRKKYLIYK